MQEKEIIFFLIFLIHRLDCLIYDNCFFTRLTFVYFNIITNKGKTILLIDEYIYSYVNEFLKNESPLQHYL